MDSVLTTQRIEDVFDDLGPVLFTAEHGRRGDRHLVKRDLRHAVPRSVLPPRAVVVKTVDSPHSFDVLATVDDALLLLRSWKAAADLWVSAATEEGARTLADEVVARVPTRPPGRRVESEFVAHDSGSRYVDLDTRPWPEVRDLYPDDVRDALDLLVAHRQDVDEPRRLLLWHGEPGTGKTTAIRALLHAWQQWAAPVVVTDPETLFADAKYMRRVVLDPPDEDRWKLLVLEDAEALLHKGSGKGLAKLLNLCDGLLGQGQRALFLITTNEPLAVVHPALVRPGRCLARVEFGPLPPDRARRLTGRPVDRAVTLAELLATGPLSVHREPVGTGRYL